MKTPYLLSMGLAALLAAGALSCNGGSSGSAQQDSASTTVTGLSARIETLHEESMNKIAPLRRAEDSLHGRIAILAASQGDTTNLAAVARQLNHCDTLMFGWMGRYDMQLKGLTDTEKTRYLQGQVQELSAINHQIDSALAAAGKLLGRTEDL